MSSVKESKITIPEFLVKHRGFFDQQALFQAIQGWFAAEEMDFSLGDYKIKSTDTGTEILYTAKADRKMTDYIKFYIEIRMRIFNMRDVEIVQDGNKKKLQEGQIVVEINSTLETDWQGRFEKGTWTQKMGTLIKEKILKYKISDYYEDMLIDKDQSLIRTIKTALGQEVI